MQPVRSSSIHNPGTLWMLLALPAALMIWNWLSGTLSATALLHPSGETSARLMIAAMAIGPLRALLGPRDWLDWLAARRRWLGVAACCYALVHLLFYVIATGPVDAMLADARAPGIWTGWAALALLLPMALTSNDAAMRALRHNWKRIQRLVYPAALLTLLHWLWVQDGMAAALIHFAPLGLIELGRIGKRIAQSRG